MAKQRKCFEHQHMTTEEYGLWSLYRGLSLKSGEVFDDGRTTADRFADESYSHIYRIRRSLIKKGFLEVKKKSTRDKATQRLTATVFRAITHEEWVRKHGTKHCCTSSPPVSQVKQEKRVEPVSQVKMSCVTGENEPVAQVTHKPKENPLSLKKASLSSASPSEEGSRDLLFSEIQKQDTQNIAWQSTKAEPVSPVTQDPYEGKYIPELLKLLPDGGKPWAKKRGYDYTRAELIEEIRKQAQEAASQ